VDYENLQEYARLFETANMMSGWLEQARGLDRCRACPKCGRIFLQNSYDGVCTCGGGNKSPCLTITLREWINALNRNFQVNYLSYNNKYYGVLICVEVKSGEHSPYRLEINTGHNIIELAGDCFYEDMDDTVELKLPQQLTDAIYAALKDLGLPEIE
jgi:hypothetical protein